MIAVQTQKFPEVIVLSLSSHHDQRGFFEEIFEKNRYHDHAMTDTWVQDNHSYSVKGTIRGMHFQSEPGQAKLITVIHGTIYDVFVDLRKDSPTFGKWGYYELSAKRHEQIYIPKGFAHGFATISDEAHVIYKVSSTYNPKTERVFYYHDPEIGIQWPFDDPILSEKDRSAPRFNEAV